MPKTNKSINQILNSLKRPALKGHSIGFTIVELLVVIVVISILATITFVSYTSITRKATEAAITVDLNNAYKKFKIYQVENGVYPTGIELNCLTQTDPAKICLTPNPNDQYTLSVDNSSPSNQKFCLSILNSAINANYYVNNNGLIASGLCPYELTLIAGAGGTVSAGGSFAQGSTQTITATPNIIYLFNSWSGSTGCAGLASHTITMDSDKTCTASFTQDTNWIPGVAATPLAGKYVRNADLGSTYAFKNANTGIASPQGATGLDPNYMSKMSLVSPQANPSVDFSAYPAQNACKSIGGRVPNTQELIALYTNKVSYGNNFGSPVYNSSTENDTSTQIYGIYFPTGNITSYLRMEPHAIRCVAG